jgi:hypothetical protein
MNGFDTVGAVSALLFSSGSASSWLHHTLDVLPSRRTHFCLYVVDFTTELLLRRSSSVVKSTTYKLWQENPTAVTMCASPLL